MASTPPSFEDLAGQRAAGMNAMTLRLPPQGHWHLLCDEQLGAPMLVLRQKYPRAPRRQQ